jgi:hypothetical protein
MNVPCLLQLQSIITYHSVVLLIVMFFLCLRDYLPTLCALVVIPRACCLMDAILGLLYLLAAHAAGLSSNLLHIEMFVSESVILSKLWLRG